MPHTRPVGYRKHFPVAGVVSQVLGAAPLLQGPTAGHLGSQNGLDTLLIAGDTNYVAADASGPSVDWSWMVATFRWAIRPTLFSASNPLEFGGIGNHQVGIDNGGSQDDLFVNSVSSTYTQLGVGFAADTGWHTIMFAVDHPNERVYGGIQSGSGTAQGLSGATISGISHASGQFAGIYHRSTDGTVEIAAFATGSGTGAFGTGEDEMERVAGFINNRYAVASLHAGHSYFSADPLIALPTIQTDVPSIKSYYDASGLTI